MYKGKRGLKCIRVNWIDGYNCKRGLLYIRVNVYKGKRG